MPLRRCSGQEPEICIAEATSEPAPLRRSDRKKQPVPHCPVCDHEIREDCGGRE